MEQNNLIVTPDGKTWDEVTRDTSYIGTQTHRVYTETQVTNSTGTVIFTEHRGYENLRHMGWKNFVHAYDREICLRDGTYEIMASTIKTINTTYHVNILINGTAVKKGHSTNIGHDTITNIIVIHLKRGDTVQLQGGWYGNADASSSYSHFHIRRVD